MLGFSSAAGSLAGGLAGIGTGIANTILANKQFKYQQQLNQTLMDREDTAVQRRAKDLEASGLSKTLAAGGAAAAQPMSAGEAPQVDPSLAQGIDSAGRSWQQYELNYLKQRQFESEQKSLNADTLIKEYNLMQGMLADLPVGERPNLESWVTREISQLAKRISSGIEQQKRPTYNYGGFWQKVKDKFDEHKRRFWSRQNGPQARRALEKYDRFRGRYGS